VIKSTTVLHVVFFAHLLLSIVISWPDQRTLRHLLRSFDRNIFGGPVQNERRKVLSMSTIPLEGRKLDVHPEWDE